MLIVVSDGRKWASVPVDRMLMDDINAITHAVELADQKLENRG